MPTVSVVIPYAGTCPHRESAYAWVRARLAAAHPAWEVVVGGGGDPWCKAAAVEDGLSRASGDVLIVHDSDVWTDLEPAVGAVVAGAPWARPHGQVYRFAQAASERIINGDEPAQVATESSVLTEPAYHGWDGGGVVVLRRDDYQRAPLDRRYIGWGSEDDSWARALSTIVGPQVQFEAPLFHLWHPVQPRLTRIVGSKASRDLWGRYKAATWHADRMAALIAEGRPDGSPSGSPPFSSPGPSTRPSARS